MSSPRLFFAKQFVRKFEENFGNKFTLPTLVIRNYVLEP
jgi:hypothetical protein